MHFFLARFFCGKFCKTVLKLTKFLFWVSFKVVTLLRGHEVKIFNLYFSFKLEKCFHGNTKNWRGTSSKRETPFK